MERSILNTIIGGYWWHDLKVDIEVLCMHSRFVPRQSHVCTILGFYPTKKRISMLRHVKAMYCCIGLFQIRSVRPIPSMR